LIDWTMNRIYVVYRANLQKIFKVTLRQTAYKT